MLHLLVLSLNMHLRILGKYDTPSGLQQFSEDVKLLLSSLWPPEEFSTIQLLISGIRERALDLLYEQDLGDSGIELLDGNGQAIQG